MPIRPATERPDSRAAADSAPRIGVFRHRASIPGTSSAFPAPAERATKTSPAPNPAVSSGIGETTTPSRVNVVADRRSAPRRRFAPAPADRVPG